MAAQSGLWAVLVALVSEEVVTLMVPKYLYMVAR